MAAHLPAYVPSNCPCDLRSSGRRSPHSKNTAACSSTLFCEVQVVAQPFFLSVGRPTICQNRRGSLLKTPLPASAVGKAWTSTILITASAKLTYLPQALAAGPSHLKGGLWLQGIALGAKPVRHKSQLHHSTEKSPGSSRKLGTTAGDLTSGTPERSVRGEPPRVR